ncbi:FAD-dependent oxidoreductase [Acidaminobacter sp. JC074]|uniref:FAD-dependent oxidoreductase n=1 Tax=Acidaminobacter sp. JC074 TaxID=2530199 RepID=UPI001F0F0506|nr:FAD-dependent oxidoreductase [Acidaminobacter sp. JC074]MCH4886900.1 FAD-dependent oxidoreductase [Acidaminobacter sp. JC074]
MKTQSYKYDVVVVGGGMSGVCAAISAARQGAKTALIQNRSVLGGNASSEVRMHIGGADFHSSRTNSRETGIIEEILLDNKKVNPQKSYSEFDRVLWEKTRFQDNLELHLNTNIHEVLTENGSVKQVIGIQNTTEKIMTFEGDIFIDTTGDATVASLAGAEIMYGRDDKASFNEEHAPDLADDITMGLTLMFTTKDLGKPAPFEKPDWAYEFTEEELKGRGHSAYGSNYWWIELGGDKLHTIFDGETIRDELLKCVYGVWDHIKNKGDHGAENYALDWVGFLPGKRESRRVVGDYILTENDLKETTHFEDLVAYGGWPMDMHAVGGIFSKHEPTEFIDVPEIYGIPYRSLISKVHKNLLIGGRAISVSRMAFGSTRLMATCAVVGQAAGTAAGMSKMKNISIRDLDVRDLQETLMLDDAFLPKMKLDLRDNLIRSAQLNASKMENLENIRDGVLRDAFDENHGWQDKLSDAFIEAKWDGPKFMKEIYLYMDTNLSRQIMITHFRNGSEDQLEGLSHEIIKSYDLDFYCKGELIKSIKINNNHYRMNKHELSIDADKVVFRPRETYGSDVAKIFEIVIR